MNNPIHAFEANNYLLGHAWESAPVQALIEGWKQLEWLDQEALKKARTDHRLSLMNPALGLYLFFTDAESYEARYGQPCSRGSLILSRVSLMVNFNLQWSPYAGVLPLSLRADDMAGDVLQQLGSPAEMWRVGLKVAKARWSLERAEVDASFETGTGRLRLVTMTPPRVQPVLAAAVPSPEQFARQFGRPLAELQGEAQFDIFSLGRKAREIAEYGEADYSDQLGIELYFKPGAEMSDFIPTAARSSQPCLSGVRYRADLDFQSSGYAGALPWGLQMSDTLHVVAAKAAVQPLKEVLDDDDGYQLWRTDLCDVHVLHSFLEDRIYRVTLLARGCYE
ncbi:hypothetical protein VLK31_17950 [Variovorax sp. H27-G14]|uniref:hypothetical protein n=1 Tax=Variovorax sp. H27-G14 TaxID=3111914 RepID=UPI0038FC066D